MSVQPEKYKEGEFLGVAHLGPTCIVSGGGGAWETYWKHLEKENEHVVVHQNPYLGREFDLLAKLEDCGVIF